MSLSVLLIANDQTLEITGLQDRNTGAFITSAVVSAIITDKLTGTKIGSTISLAYVLLTSGTYRGNISDDIAIVSGRMYAISITAVQGTDKANWLLEVQAQHRR